MIPLTESVKCLYGQSICYECDLSRLCRSVQHLILPVVETKFWVDDAPHAVHGAGKIFFATVQI